MSHDPYSTYSFLCPKIQFVRSFLRFLLHVNPSYKYVRLRWCPLKTCWNIHPPLPLTVDYSGEDGITAEGDEGILLALEQRHRIRRLRLYFPIQNLQKLVKAIDGEFPTLEYLIVDRYPSKDDMALMLPETLQAPHLRHFMQGSFACPIRSRLYPSAPGLVSLLIITHPSAYFQPNILLQWISYMPQLESLEVAFSFPVPNRDVERQLTHTPIMTLPNLHFFGFRGVCAYLEAVVCQITTPHLERLQFDPSSNSRFPFHISPSI